MAEKNWPSRSMAVKNIYLDHKNPRLGQKASQLSPHEIIQYLFDHDSAEEIAFSINTRGYFANEPILVVKEGQKYIAVEGNRRLAALKALQEPKLLDARDAKRLEQALAKSRRKPPSAVPVVIAPNRRATDRLVAGRHVGRAVKPWQADDRAGFILQKMADGYSNEELINDLGFKQGDIQQARQTRAITTLARTLPLEPEVAEKYASPRPALFTNIERVVESKAGRQYLHIEPSFEHGFVFTTSAKEARKGMVRILSDAAKGHLSSRKMNKNDDIANYFRSWAPGELPEKKQRNATPDDLESSGGRKKTKAVTRKKKKVSTRRRVHDTVIPSSFKPIHGEARLFEIRKELATLKSEKYPNAGAVLLRVYFELAALHYLDRIGRLETFVAELKKKNVLLKNGVPTLKELRKELTKIAKAKLPAAHANSVEKAIRQDQSAPFGLDDLHSFVHQRHELPGKRDIDQFWSRMEPLFEMMLAEDDPADGE